MEEYTSTKYSSTRAQDVRDRFITTVALLREANRKNDCIAIDYLINDLELLKVEFEYICRM